MITTMSWIATIVAISGNVFINNQNKIGFYVWMVANVMWISINIINFNPPQIALFSIYTLFNIHGLYKWKKGEKTEKRYIQKIKPKTLKKVA